MTKELTFKYVFAEDYNPRFATGVHGHVTPRGDITMNFFHERKPVPRRTTVEFSDAGEKLKEVHKPEQNQLVIRFVQSGIVLMRDDAVSVRDWLTQMIESYDAFANKESEEGAGDENGSSG